MLHVTRSGLTSNVVEVAYAAVPVAQAGDVTQGGPFAVQPVFAQKSIKFSHVRLLTKLNTFSTLSC